MCFLYHPLLFRTYMGVRDMGAKLPGRQRDRQRDRQKCPFVLRPSAPVIPCLSGLRSAALNTDQFSTITEMVGREMHTSAARHRSSLARPYVSLRFFSFFFFFCRDGPRRLKQDWKKTFVSQSHVTSLSKSMGSTLLLKNAVKSCLSKPSIFCMYGLHKLFHFIKEYRND